jgi:amino acid adenylation domain-containing protein
MMPARAAGPALGVAGGFLRSAERHAERPALVVDGAEISYAELSAAAQRVAATVDSLTRNELCAVLGVATHTVFESILGVLFSGRAYVPLNPAFPLARTAYMIEASQVDLVLVDRVGEALLPELLPHLGAPLSFLLPHAGDDAVLRLARQFPAMRFVGASGVAAKQYIARDVVEPAYLMFTSGSTGQPKGVVVANANVRSFIESMKRIYDFGPDDRFSQMFDLTFDLSVFDMFVCWEAGASLWVVPPKSRMAPAAFLRKSQLTVWFSVPAVAAFMNQLKTLRANNFPSLRYSLFCGEPLPASVAEAWQLAAPASVLDNLYGPTELTIACSYHRWSSRDSPSICLNGVVPIGAVYDGLESAVVDAELRKVRSGEPGELCVRGPQTTPGYWRNAELTAQRFVAMPWARGTDNRWYRTGDVVRELDDGQMVFVGRVDNQVKILGYRVELGEVEAKLREAGRTDFAIAVPWPVAPGAGAAGLVACLAGSPVDDDAVLEACRVALPAYMVPQWILRLERMPLNSNGKIDRNALKSLVEEHSARR